MQTNTEITMVTVLRGTHKSIVQTRPLFQQAQYWGESGFHKCCTVGTECHLVTYGAATLQGMSS